MIPADAVAVNSPGQYLLTSPGSCSAVIIGNQTPYTLIASSAHTIAPWSQAAFSLNGSQQVQISALDPTSIGNVAGYVSSTWLQAGEALPTGYPVAAAPGVALLAQLTASSLTASGLAADIADQIVGSPLASNTGSATANGATWTTASSGLANAIRVLTPWESNRSAVCLTVTNAVFNGTGQQIQTFSRAITSNGSGGVNVQANVTFTVDSGYIFRITKMIVDTHNLTTSGATADAEVGIGNGGTPFVVVAAHWQTPADIIIGATEAEGYELPSGTYNLWWNCNNISPSTTAYFDFTCHGFTYPA